MSAGTIYRMTLTIENGIVVLWIVESNCFKAFIEFKRLEKYIL